MQTLIKFLYDAPLTASCLGEVTEDSVELRHGIYGLRITPEIGPSDYIKDKYQATTFKMEGGEQIPGHHTDILEYYWYTDLTPDELLKVFAQLVKLA